MEKELSNHMDEIMQESVMAPPPTEEEVQRINKMLSRPFRMAKYDATKVKFFDYKGERGKVACEFCGDHKKKGHDMCFPIFADSIELGYFSFFMCGKTCARAWIKNSKNGFPITDERVNEIFEKTGRHLFPMDSFLDKLEEHDKLFTKNPLDERISELRNEIFSIQRFLKSPKPPFESADSHLRLLMEGFSKTVFSLEEVVGSALLAGKLMYGKEEITPEIIEKINTAWSWKFEVPAPNPGILKNTRKNKKIN
jgi:antitoxin component HigA of HigAB toxin-antitoxin module